MFRYSQQNHVTIPLHVVFFPYFTFMKRNAEEWEKRSEENRHCKWWLESWYRAIKLLYSSNFKSV